MSFLHRCVKPQGSDENLHQIGETGDCRYRGWLLMSPIQFPGKEPNTIVFSRRHWKRQYFELSLIHGRTTGDPNRYTLHCYSRDDRKRLKGCIDLDTVTDLQTMSLPPTQLLGMISQKHLSDECQQGDKRSRVLICNQLPFFSFDAEFCDVRGRVYLLADDGRQMLEWVRHLRAACGQPDLDVADQSAVAPSPMPPIQPAIMPKFFPGSSPQQHLQQWPIVESEYAVNRIGTPDPNSIEETYGVPGSGDGTYGDLLAKSSDDEYGELESKTRDDGIYGDVRADSSLMPQMARDSIDSGAFSGPPSIPPRQHQYQDSSRATNLPLSQRARESVDYENLSRVVAAAAAAETESEREDHVYGNLCSQKY